MDLYDIAVARKLSGGGGGGGSSDFPTAYVTYVADGQSAFFNGSYYNEDTSEEYTVALFKDGDRYVKERYIGDAGTYEVLLIDTPAPCICVYSEPVITGNATVEQMGGDWVVAITGDCTITIS